MFDIVLRMRIVTAVVGLALAAPSPAALLKINDLSLPASADGFNITRDTSTGLDWLDLDLSIGRSFDDLNGISDPVNDFLPGGDFAGFRHARVRELTGSTAVGTVDSLFKSVSDATPGSTINTSAFGDGQSFDAVRTLLDHVGCFGPACATHGYVFGNILLELPDTTLDQRAQFVQAFSGGGLAFGGQGALVGPSEEGNINLFFPNDPNGPGNPPDPDPIKANWLVRATPTSVPPGVPEPGTGLLLALGLAGGVVAARRGRR